MDQRHKRPPFVIIINKPGGWYGLAVDNIDGIPQINKQRLRPLGSMLTPFAGVTDAVITHTEGEADQSSQHQDSSEGMVLLLNNERLEAMLVQRSVGVKSAA
jgi:chemotaxis signal transduction protein